MTKLNTMALGRGRPYEPAPFLGAFPLLASEASIERWHAATRTLVNPTPSGYDNRRPPDLPIDRQLFGALAFFKVKTAMLAAGHFSREKRDRLFRQLDSLLDIESWDSADPVPNEASFTTLLRMVLFLQGRPPALGITGSGTFLATWTEGDDRLTIECQPEDHVRWVLIQNLDGQRESAAGETTIRRLPEVLRPYDPPQRWFPNATQADQAST
jgi:hypothetical protein